MGKNIKIWRESASLIMAAKLNICQPSQHNYKLLCLQRSSTSEYMPSTYVFPGGNICNSDKSIKWLKFFEKFGFKLESFKQLYPEENVPSVLQTIEENCLPKYISLRICAIRETFEECGILICKKADKRSTQNSINWATNFTSHEVLKWQDRVHDDPNEFINLCSEYQILPDLWALHNWSNWVTPPSVPTRFNTMFFFSSLCQVPIVQREEKEIQNIKWATPDEIIAENHVKQIMLPVPQYYEISRFRNFSDITLLSKYATERASYGCEKYFPHRIMTKDGLFSIFPGDDLYPSEVDKENVNIEVIEELPNSNIQNRLLIKDQYEMKLFIKNVLPKDKHVPPVVNC